MDESDRKAINKMVTHFTLGLKMSRIHEALRKLRLYGFDKVQIKSVGKDFQEAVRNFNESIGQKV